MFNAEETEYPKNSTNVFCFQEEDEVFINFDTDIEMICASRFQIIHFN